MIAATTTTTTPTMVESSSMRMTRSAAPRVTSSPSPWGFQQLDRIAVETGAGEQALLAARPGREPQLGDLPRALQPQPGKRRRVVRAGAGGGDRRPQLVPFVLLHVKGEDRVEEDGRDAIDRLGQPLPRPGCRRRPL